MKHLLLLPLLALALHMQAQRVTNVTAEQLGQELLIHYHLEAEGPVEVLLYLSTDRGSRWEGPLKSCSGDVGPNVAPGTDKRIRWEVLKDRELVGDGIAFKVVAKGGVKKDWLNPALTYGSVTDIDGNTYATIEIGTQVWMAENLRTTRYQNGDPIPNVTGDVQWSNLSSGAWCHYANDPSYEVPYGKLYNWYTVNDSRKLCPSGWHIPTLKEWGFIRDQLGGFSIAGGKMKTTDISHYYWKPPSSGASNSSGFSAIPVGKRDDDGIFYYFEILGHWWSASEADAELSSLLIISNEEAYLIQGDFSKGSGLSVRCIRD
jgi:uncharacterized protein (TIGR02145 family)